MKKKQRPQEVKSVSKVTQAASGREGFKPSVADCILKDNHTLNIITKGLIRRRQEGEREVEVMRRKKLELWGRGHEPGDAGSL